MSRPAFMCVLALAVAQAVPAGAATFLFIRHAESTANAGTATTVDELVDPPLTPLGQQQALDLAEDLAGHDVTTIYTSAYQRTQLTIAPTAARYGLTPIADARTNEWYFGDVTSLSELAGLDVYGIIGAWAAGNTSAKADLPNAESLDDMIARVVPAWEEITRAHMDDEGIVLLVGHGAETGFVMPSFAANVSPSFAFQNGLRNTGIVQVEFSNGRPYVTDWQGTAFDEEGPTPTPAPVPLPASGLMLLAAIGPLLLVRRRKARTTA